MITIPKLQALYNKLIADLESEFSISIPLFGKLFLRPLASALSGSFKLLYLTIADTQKNIWVDTADPETLKRYGRVKLNRDPFAATQGQYAVAVTGTIGSTIPALTVFKSNDNAQNPGKLFILDTGYTTVSSPDAITLRALESGLGSQLNVGESLTATAPINGVDDAATVTAESVTPQAEEDIEDYREKVLAAYRIEPQGGAAADYRIWSYDAQGVKQTYPYATSGSANEVDVFVEATIADSTDGKGTPSGTTLTDVAAVIEQDPDTSKPLSERGRRPLAVFAVNVLPVVIREIAITITDFVDITAAKETIILDALTEAIAEIRPFIAGADVLSSKNDTLGQNNIISIILNAIPGAQFTSVSMTVDASPETNYVFDLGNIPHLDTVTYA